MPVTYDPDSIIRRVLKVASLPQIFIKVEETLNNPLSSKLHLSQIIEEDPGLTARLLKLSNSAFYGFSAKVETAKHAITVLGTQQLRELVLACSVMKVFKSVPSDLVDMESFWRHSIACGVAARSLASLRYESNVERYFVAGLLHDIGRLIILMQLPQIVPKVFLKAKLQKQFLFKVEHELLGFNHATLGGLLLASWELSPRMVESIKYHHYPTMAKSHPIDAAIIHTADIIANSMQMGSSGERLIPQLNPKSWDSLGLPVDSIEHVLKTLQEQYKDAVEFILDKNE